MLTLDFIHKQGIVHRDIKLDNILINKIEENEYVVKIADFGLATFAGVKQPLLFTKCGSPGYTAPEILRGFGYSLNSDIFSLGAVFFNLLTGCYLFSGETNEEVLRKNKICDIKDILKNLSNLPDLKVSESCIEALCLMLTTDPKKRPQACELLNHRWFKSNLDAIMNLLAQNHSIAI